MKKVFDTLEHWSHGLQNRAEFHTQRADHTAELGLSSPLTRTEAFLLGLAGRGFGMVARAIEAPDPVPAFSDERVFTGQAFIEPYQPQSTSEDVAAQYQALSMAHADGAIQARSE